MKIELSMQNNADTTIQIEISLVNMFFLLRRIILIGIVLVNTNVFRALQEFRIPWYDMKLSHPEPEPEPDRKGTYVPFR